jgi:hypothetical protein
MAVTVMRQPTGNGEATLQLVLTSVKWSWSKDKKLSLHGMEILADCSEDRRTRRS